MYLFNSTFQYFDLNLHSNSSTQLPSDSHLEQSFFIMRGKKEAFTRHDYFHRIIESDILFASGFHNCLLCGKHRRQKCWVSLEDPSALL